MLIFELHLPHVIVNNMQSLRFLSHLYIKQQPLPPSEFHQMVLKISIVELMGSSIKTTSLKIVLKHTADWKGLANKLVS